MVFSEIVLWALPLSLCTCWVTSAVSALCNPWDWSPPGSPVHGILQARVLEWVAMPSSRGSFQPRDWTHSSCCSCIMGIFFYCWTTREAPLFLYTLLYLFSSWHSLSPKIYLVICLCLSMPPHFLSWVKCWGQRFSEVLSLITPCPAPA